MKMPEFQAQVQRLKNCFGERVYPSEREKVLWREVASQDDKWFERTCDHFIASRKLNDPPMPVDFAQALREERERTYENDKAKRAHDADQFWSAAPPGFFDKIFNRMEKTEEDENERE